MEPRGTSLVEPPSWNLVEPGVPGGKSEAQQQQQQQQPWLAEAWLAEAWLAEAWLAEAWLAIASLGAWQPQQSSWTGVG